MKKVRKSLPVLTMVFGLSLSAALIAGGCQGLSQQPTAPNTDQAPQDQRDGVIQSLGGVSTSNEGTDLLTMNDGTTILLRSAAINLDDAKYAGQEVEVSGVINTTADNKQIMDVENIDILGNAQAPTQMQVQAPTWVSYSNPGLNFSVQYRNDFTLNENGQTITFTRPVAADAFMMNSSEQTSSSEQMTTQHVITVQVTPHSPSANLLQDFLKLPDDSNSTLMSAGLSKSKIGTNGIDAYKSVTTNDVTFSFDSSGNFYQISYSGGNDSQNIEDQNIFYQFLSSFQLLNAPPSTQQPIITPVAPTVPTAPATTSTTTSASSTTSSTTPSSTTTSSSASAAASTSNMTTSTQDMSNNGTNGSVTMGVSVAPTQQSSTSNMSSGGTQELLSGYDLFTSTAYKFTLEYPKNWYYGQSTTTDTTVVRRYNFGSQPVDQTPGNVNLDIVSGSIPSGAAYTVGDKNATLVQENGISSYYYQGQNGRIYRVSGPSADDYALRSMLSTLQEQ